MTIDFNEDGGGAQLPEQVTSGERTAGTETDLRSFSPADVAAMATIHGPGGTPTAAGVSFSPVGGLSATNVQDMGAELDSEKISNSAIGVTVESFADAVSQPEAEAGLVTAKRTWSPERINQAIQALAPARPVDFVSNVDSSTILGRATAGNGPSEELTAAQVRTLINVENGAAADQTDAEIEAAYNAQVSVISQAEAEAGTSTVVRRWTAQRVAQAIAALASGGGDAFTASPLSQFAPTTSLQLAGVMTDATGTGLLVFNTSPTLVTPALGTPSAINLANATGVPASQISGVIPIANLATGTPDGTKFIRDDGTLQPGGNVSNSGVPADGQIGIWTGPNSMEGDPAFTFDTTDDTVIIGAGGGVEIGGANILRDAAGVLTLDNVDVLGATALATIRAAIVAVADVANDTILGRTTAGSGPSEELTAAQVRTLINVENGATADQTDAEIEAAYNAQVSVISQAEAEAGTSTVVRRWTAQRVAQAIAALGGGGGGSFALPTRNDDSDETVPVTTDTRVSITTATITKTLPTSPTDGVFVAITLDAVTAGTGRVTVARGGTNTIDWKGVQINSVVLAEVGDRVVFCFDGDNGRWRLVYDGINGPYLHARRITSDQTMTANTYDLVEWNQALIDYHGILDTSTNIGRVTPTIPGVYAFEPVVTTENQVNGIRELKVLNLYANGSSEIWGSVSQYSDSEHQKEVFIHKVNGSSDYVETYFRAYSADHVLFAYNVGTNRRTEMRVRRIK